MGFLDHSTNNIIVDAVLTDYGRQKLASQGGAATKLVSYYAFADEEVDYSMITKYGVIVGKEKIEKNTPIFEATTNAKYSGNSLLRSVANASGQQASTTISLNQASLTTASGSDSTILNITVTDALGQLESTTFLVYYDFRFLSLSASGSDVQQDTATTKVLKLESNSPSSGGAINITIIKSGADIMKEVYGTLTDMTTIQIVNAATGEKSFQELQLDYS